MGQGVAWPFRIGPTGGVVTDSGQQRKRRQLAHAIMTAVNERIDDPSLGVMGNKYVFRTGTPKSLQNVFRFLMRETLTKHIQQIRLDNLRFLMFTTSDGTQRWVVEVLYTDLETYQQERIGVEIPNPNGR